MIKVGDTSYIVESNRFVREVTVLRNASGIYFRKIIFRFFAVYVIAELVIFDV